MNEVIDSNGLVMMSGTIEHIVYTNDENGFAICEISTEKNELVTIKGIIPMPGEGDNLTVYGRWIHDAKYGRQFAVERFEKTIPSDTASVLRYLSSRAIKGIGPKLAKRIVEEFGDETFDVIENHPEWLADIRGISLSKAYEISKDFSEKSGVRNAMLYFGEYFGPSIIVKIYKKWGGNAVSAAQKNPYVLCEEIDGIGFEKADNMAQGMGFPHDGDERIKSGVLYVLRFNTLQNGHTCLPREKLIKASADMLGVDGERVERAVRSLISEKKLCVNTFDGIQFIFDKYTYECEKYIAAKLSLLDKTCVTVDHRDIEAFLQKEELESGISYASLQRKAIIDAMRNGVMVLTGGPGTGKTTVVKGLLHIFESMGYKVALTAPTGRAAKRLSESTGREAKTVHRLLEMSFSGDDSVGSTRHSEFMRNESNLLDENVIIVDEASMVDVYLMASLLKAIKPGAKLVFIGDADQLPSVGAGNVLRDLIDCGGFSVVALTEIFRQAKESLIVRNAHAINTGLMPDLSVKDNDFFFLPRESDRDIALTVADLCKNRLPKSYGAGIIDGIQVITPSRKGEGGTDNLNHLLQSVLNPEDRSKKEYIYRETTYRVGDKVMQTKNNYDIEWTRDDGSEGVGIFNGDVGIIKAIDRENQCMRIDFDEKSVVYDFTLLDELCKAYAITVHKSQGSEYPVVIIPLYNAPPMLLSRNMLYTAVTRASKMVILVGRRDIAEKMVANNKQTLRYTGLCKRLAQGE